MNLNSDCQVKHDVPHRSLHPGAGRRGLRIVAALIAGALVGGAGVSFASPASQVTFCVHKKTAVVRMPKSGKCARSESRLVLAMSSSAGILGPVGPKGDAGAPGERGPAGDKGATGAAGRDGAAGLQGPAGPSGETGAAGANGLDGTSVVGPAGATGASGDQWTTVGESAGAFGSFAWDRALGLALPLGPVTGLEFEVDCWKAGSTTPTHVLTYELGPNVYVVATAYTIGGPDDTATWIERTMGRRDIGSARTTSTRWVISVRNTNGETTKTYEIIVEMSADYCVARLSVVG